MQDGQFIGIDAPEFQSHAAGQIIGINGHTTDNPDAMLIDDVTHPDTADVSDTPSPNHSGLYRDPTYLSDGSILAVHTAETRQDLNEGTRAFPQSRYDFRIKVISQNGTYFEPAATLTTGINKNITYYDPDVLVTYNGELWELYPVEVVARSRPTHPTKTLSAPEVQIFTEEGVDIEAFKAWMADRDLALAVSRNVTTRDQADTQQPYNLSIPGGVSSTATSGKIYDIEYLQFFQADHLRGLGGTTDPRPGRRVLAQPMHDENVDNPPTTGPQGSVNLGLDGSMAAFVPAQRAMTWQLIEPDHTPVVRERYWVNFQPGEIRVCASCHGVNTQDQMGSAAPENPPEALRDLLQHWKTIFCNPTGIDQNQNGTIEITDAVLVVSGSDTNCDGTIDITDLGPIYAAWLNTL